MKEKLEIFELSMELAKALGGDKEAIANIALLYVRHPEMFKNIQDVIKTIDEVVRDPEIIMKNYKNISIDNEILAVKKINDKKVGDVVIKNDNGTNVIFHANKTPIRNFRRFYKKAISGGDVRSLHISEQVCLGANNKELSGANALSLTAEKIIPQNSQSKLKKFVDKSNDEAIIPTKQRKR